MNSRDASFPTAFGTPLIQAEGLTVTFRTDLGTVEAVRNVDFTIAPGETVALVGESGSGKTAAALSLVRLLPSSARITARTLRFQRTDILSLPEDRLRQLRGDRIAMIFQEPMSALNPLHPVGRQIAEPLTLHQGLSSGEAWERAEGLLARTGVEDPQRRMFSFPHQLSGGQRQRVMIAMALACRPALLIADEPTTALDVTIQAQILDLLQALQREMGMALLLITHDLPMVRRAADRVYVMRRGELVENGPVEKIFSAPQHDYTRMLLASLPSETPPPRPARAETLYEARDVTCHFTVRRGFFNRVATVIRAVDGVTLTLRRGETVGVVGESGSGKSTLGEALLRLNAASGSFHLAGIDLATLSRRELSQVRRRMQVVFQDPFASLSPRMTVGEILQEGLRAHHLLPEPGARRRKAEAVLQEVGLSAESIDRYPHEFSGGQRQRIAIARAMVMAPELLILDEPTSALDLSIQAQVLALLKDLQQRHGLAYLFISHDLRVVRSMAHEVLVMRHGQVVERGRAEAIFSAPQQPYTRQLLQAALGGPREKGVLNARECQSDSKAVLHIAG
ncbi:MAG: ABC transporter ATP-binding protein [Magnetococcales bacterium]|nr:ABC transporter ATP-binding protein [Magnetococcales bacterium]